MPPASGNQRVRRLTEGSSLGAGLAQGISITAQQRDKREKLAVIPARVTEYTGMETKLHPFLISTLDVEIEVPETEGVDPPLRRRQFFWLYLWKPSPFGVLIGTRYGLDGPGIESRGNEIFRTCPDRPSGPLSLLYNGYRVFPGGKAAGAWR
jgi:hypothetical protein